MKCSGWALPAVVVMIASCGAPSDPAAPTSARPPVERGLDASAYASAEEVCGLVPAHVLERLDVEISGSGATMPENPSCGLQGRDRMRVQLFSETDRLARAYAMNRPGSGSYPHFIEAVAIGGQPAAHVRQHEVDTSTWCLVVVALSDESSLEVESTTRNACERADILAEAVVEKLAG